MTKNLFKLTAVALAIAVTGLAHAWYIKDINPDRKDVFCKNDTFVGSIYRNGNMWSDGLRSHSDPAEVARQMVAAQGSACE